jgi:hypothetical protein
VSAVAASGAAPKRMMAASAARVTRFPGRWVLAMVAISLLKKK